MFCGMNAKNIEHMRVFNVKDLKILWKDRKQYCMDTCFFRGQKHKSNSGTRPRMVVIILLLDGWMDG